MDDIILEGSLVITIDQTPPSGVGNLHPDSDSGVPGFPDTMADRITSDRTPSFFGVAEANSIVTVTIRDSAGKEMPAGTTVAAPLDGNDNFPLQDVEGNWRIDTNLNLDDGEYSAVFTFEDVAGNQFESPDKVFFLVDTQGPRVTDVRISNLGNPYDLFVPKPWNGPTPLAHSLVVTLSDLPNRTAHFPFYDAVFAATASNVGHYQVVGDSNGIIPIAGVTFTPLNVAAGDPATGYVTIHFLEPLPDDRFTLTITGLVDPVGNALDGESSASQPGFLNRFPTGDGQPGGDFVARFTVDSRAEIGAWSAGSVYLDTNGNFSFDWNNADATNRDSMFTLGYATDHIFAGDFDGSGFDQIAAYRRSPSGFEWLINDDLFAPNLSRATNGAIGIPVAGDFNGNPDDGDEVGVFTGTHWLLDTSDPKNFQLNTRVASGIRGLPIVGDFDGDGDDDLGTYNPNTNTFFLSLSNQGGGITNAALSTTFRVGSGFPFIGVRERPVAADMNGDGFDDIGLWVPDRSGVTPMAAAEWYFFVSGLELPLAHRAILGQGVINFRPAPFGRDIYAQFGDQFAIPIVGNFDPPVTGRLRTRFGDEQAPDNVNQDAIGGSESDALAEQGRGDSSVESQSTQTQPPLPLAQPSADVFASEDATATTIDLPASFEGPDGTALLSSAAAHTDAALVNASVDGTSLALQHTPDEGGVGQRALTMGITGAPLTMTTTSDEARDASDNVVLSSQAISVTTRGAGSETGTTLNTVTRDIDDNVVTLSESSSVTTEEVDPDTGKLLTITASTNEVTGPVGGVQATIESIVTRIDISPQIHEMNLAGQYDAGDATSAAGGELVTETTTDDGLDVDLATTSDQGPPVASEDELGVAEDPTPASVTLAIADAEYPWHNSAEPADVNGDTFVTARDALLVIEELNKEVAGVLQDPEPGYLSRYFFDVNRDGFLYPIDALMVIHKMNVEIEGEGEFDTQLSSESIGILPAVIPPASHATTVTDAGNAGEYRMPDQSALASSLAGSPSSELPHGPQLWDSDENWTAKNLEDVLDELGMDVNNALDI